MKQGVENIGNIIAEPSALFSELKSQPRWGIAFIAFYLVSILIGWAMMPYSETLIDIELAKNDLQSEELEATKNVAQIMKNVGVFIFPLLALLGFIIGSAILKLAARVLVKDEALEFKSIYAAIVHISLIGCLIQLVNAALLLVFGNPESVKSAIDLKMIPGLHLLFSSIGNVKLLTFLSHINPLNLWVIAVVAIAISEFTGIEKSRARIAAVILWGLSILPEVIFTS